MPSFHQFILSTDFAPRYVALKQRLPKIKHLIHGGVENFYAGVPQEHLLSEGQARYSDPSLERSFANLELGLDLIDGRSSAEGELYIECNPRAKQGEKAREAMWQFDLYGHHHFGAVIGMNLHREKDTVVATVANIQGRDKEGVSKLRDACGASPWSIESLALIVEDLPQEIGIVRGLPSRRHPFADSPGFDRHRASNLYDRTFRRLGFDAVRNEKKKVRFYELNR